MEPRPSPCEEFEIAALKRARGALAPDAVESLDAHLATCPACQDFIAATAATEGVLRERARQREEGRDFATIRAAFQRRRSAERGRLLRGVALIAVLIALDWWAFGPSLGRAFAVGAAIGAGTVFLAHVLPRHRRALRAAGAVDSDLLKFYRKDLDREITGLQRAKPLIPVVLALNGAWVLLVIANIIKERLLGFDFPDLRVSIAIFVTMALVNVPLFYQTRFLLPRLERERRDLG